MVPETDILDVLVAAGRQDQPQQIDAYHASLRAAVAERALGQKQVVRRSWKPAVSSAMALAILAAGAALLPVGPTAPASSVPVVTAPARVQEATADAGAPPPDTATPPPVEVSALPDAVGSGRETAVKNMASKNTSGAKTSTKEVATTPSVAAADTLAEEIALVEGARVALEESPQRALTMIGVLDRKYPANRVRDEADVVKIEAHARLGHTAEAEQAAKNFLSTRPQSPYAPRVRRALSNMHATP